MGMISFIKPKKVEEMTPENIKVNKEPEKVEEPIEEKPEMVEEVKVDEEPIDEEPKKVTTNRRRRRTNN